MGGGGSGSSDSFSTDSDVWNEKIKKPVFIPQYTALENNLSFANQKI